MASTPRRSKSVRGVGRSVGSMLPAPVQEWSRPVPICEYRLVGPESALLHVERKVPDRPGYVLSVGAWLAEHELSVEQFVYTPCPGGVAAADLVAAGSRMAVVEALRTTSGCASIVDVPDLSLTVPEKRHTVRCTLYLPDEILTRNILVHLGEAAFRPEAPQCPGLPYANISHLVVERAPYAFGVPGCCADMFLTGDSREVLDAAVAKLEQMREPFGSADRWIVEKWPCACPACIEAARA